MILSRLYNIFSAWRVAPYATASSGFMRSLIFFFGKKFFTKFLTIGILVEPPTKITSSISSFVKSFFNACIFLPASAIALLSGNFNLSIKGRHIFSNSCLVISKLISTLSNKLFILKVVLSDILKFFLIFSHATFNLFIA